MALPPILRDRLRLPVIASPLFIISNPDLVIAQCKAGIVGSFPALNARPISQLDEWLARITEELAAHDRANPDAPSAPFEHAGRLQAVNHPPDCYGLDFHEFGQPALANARVAVEK